MESPIIVEYRPLLRSCQFFIKKCVNPVSTVITVTQDNQVILQSETSCLKIQMPQSVTLEPGIVSSGVSIMPKLIHFRVNAKPPSGTGSFKAEVLLTASDSNGNTKTSTYVPAVVLDRPVNLLCRSCEKIFTTEPIFARVLPLPSNEDADFFCHAHSDTVMTIEPRSRDIFYGLYFFRVHCDIMEVPSGVIKCQHCSAWLGYKTSKYLQFFNSTVNFEGNESKTDTSIDDFLGIMEVLSQANNAFMNKIVLHCDVDNHARKYLLLWIFDRDLSLFSALSETPRLSDLSNDDDRLVQMKEQKVAKILYSIQFGATDLVSQWLESDRVSSVPVALSVLEQGFNYLEKMAQAIPSDFSKAYDMSLTYVIKLDK